MNVPYFVIIGISPKKTSGFSKASSFTADFGDLNDPSNPPYLNGLDGTERRILKDICAEDASYYELIDNLLDLQQTKSLLLSKYGLHNDIERRIESFVTDHKL
mgnify:CR=1 FL=1